MNYFPARATNATAVLYLLASKYSLGILLAAEGSFEGSFNS